MSFINLNLLREWNEKITKKSIEIFLNYPYEATISGFSQSMFLSFIGFAFLYFLLRIKLTKWLFYENNYQFSLSFKNFWIWIILAFINFTMIRGGWKLSPINNSMVYFSRISLENDLATNAHWEFFQEIFDSQDSRADQYLFGLNTKEILNKLKNETKAPLDIIQLDSNQKLNVVLIILESFTADLIEPLGGQNNITPNFTKLANRGILFTNFYASGNRTEKGLIAIESAFPSQAFTSIILNSEKQKKLNSLIQDFSKANYHTSFFYGGESEFFSMKSYFLNQGIDTIIDKNYFPKELLSSKWGVFDEYIFKKHLKTLEKLPSPFFSTILTLSNHEPFDLPVNPKFPGENASNKFKSTAYYVDSVLNNYLEMASKTKWYKNTLFVMVADHGHRLPLDKYEIQDYHRYRIPLLFFGEPIKKEYRGIKISDFASQTDIRASLNYLAKINPIGNNDWSRNIFIPDTNRFVFFDWDGGFGLRSPEFDYAYDIKAKKDIRLISKLDSSNSKKMKVISKAYMQKIVEDYLKLGY